MEIVEPNFSDNRFSGNNRNCQCSLRILSKAIKIHCPRGERKSGALGTFCALRLPWIFGPTRRAWPCSQQKPGGGTLPGMCFAWCLVSKEFALCRWPRAGLPALSLTFILAPYLAWLHPMGTICDNFLHFSARLWSHLPGSSFCWIWSVLWV